jgi:hypothetical protein
MRKLPMLASSTITPLFHNCESPWCFPHLRGVGSGYNAGVNNRVRGHTRIISFRKKIAFACVAVVLSLAISLALAEIGLRASGSSLVACADRCDQYISHVIWNMTQPPERPRKWTVQLASDGYMRDGGAGHLHRPNFHTIIDWPEHPRGSFAMSTNNIGLRRDADTFAKKTRRRILVTGDSHTDGFVDNADSFAARLESMLTGAEVLNAGANVYSPYNFAGCFEHFQYLHPDLLIAVVYTGNDFHDVIRVAATRNMVDPKPMPVGYDIEIKRAIDAHLGVFHQGGNQQMYFDAMPCMKAESVRLTADELARLKAVCIANGSDLLVVLLPTKFDTDAPEITTPHRRLALSLSDQLRSKGVDVFDPFDAFIESNDELFWHADYHLNVAGHELLARLLHEELKGNKLP